MVCVFFQVRVSSSQSALQRSPKNLASPIVSAEFAPEIDTHFLGPAGAKPLSNPAVSREHLRFAALADGSPATTRATNSGRQETIEAIVCH
jgi:hypothetical protein